MDTMTAETKTTIASHAMLSVRPRALAPWDPNAYATTGISFISGSAVPASGFAVEAAVCGMRDSVALQGASPPRENPR